jgi:hypothetical protein
MASGDPSRSSFVTDSGPTGSTDLDASAIVSALNKHGVRYVVIGAFAAIAQQAPVEPTRDVDLTPDTAIANLRRLSSALKDLDARISMADSRSITTARLSAEPPSGTSFVGMESSTSRSDLPGSTAVLRS